MGVNRKMGDFITQIVQFVAKNYFDQRRSLLKANFYDLFMTSSASVNLCGKLCFDFILDYLLILLFIIFFLIS